MSVRQEQVLGKVFDDRQLLLPSPSLRVTLPGCVVGGAQPAMLMCLGAAMHHIGMHKKHLLFDRT
jgi:hypothetical protein